MYVELKLPNPSNTRLLVREYDPRLDYVLSILDDVCEAIAPHANFVVSGFGEKCWPVDVLHDLPIFLEQLPVAIEALETGAETALDFCEQGIERKLEIYPREEICVIKCVSLGRWQPIPEVEEIDRAELLEMLVDVRDQFLTFLRGASSELSQHEWILSWAKGQPTSR